jgi:predicted dehydrogenase
MYNIAIIGFGYWGPNIVRNFNNHSECEVKYICDLGAEARKRASLQYPDIEIIADPEIIFLDKSVDIVAIVTPVSTHYSLAKQALEAEKHIFVEKPMVETVEQADELISIAKKNNLIGVVDHTFLFTGAVMKIKEIIDSGEIGEVTYFDSVRVNLGLFQHDVNVIWDLAPHDLSILFHLIEEQPTGVMASGVDHLNNGLVDVAYLNLHYERKMIANFHVNWLSPVKVRKILIGGTKKMIVFDDMEPSEKIKVYDKGIDIKEPKEIYKLLVKYRSGDMRAPNISQTEALGIEISHYINQIKSNSLNSLNDLKHGKQVVEIIVASNEALENNSRIAIRK